MRRVATVAANVAVVAVLAVALGTVAGCGGGKPPASPVHQVNVFFDGLSHNDYRQVCSVLKGFPDAAACERYFTVNAAISGGGLTGHAVPHSEVVRGDTATVKGVDSGGTRYVATLARQKDGGWKLTSVSAA
jgi:hypothetical protein